MNDNIRIPREVNFDINEISDDIALDESVTVDKSHESLSGLLYRPFSVEEHYFTRGLCYLKEEAINTRLTEAFGVGGWSLRITHIEYMDFRPMITVQHRGKGYLFPNQGELIPTNGENGVTITGIRPEAPGWMADGYIHAKGEHYYNTGGDVVDIMASSNQPLVERIINARKGAVTDLLKRCARMLGVGLYLTELDRSVKDYNTLGTFLHNKYPRDYRFFTLPEGVNSPDSKDHQLRASNALLKALRSAYPAVYSNGNAVKSAIQATGIDTGPFIVSNYQGIAKTLLEYAEAMS